MEDVSSEIVHDRYEVNVFADACQACGEAWPCRTVLLAENERLREALLRVTESGCDGGGRGCADLYGEDVMGNWCQACLAAYDAKAALFGSSVEQP